MSSNTESDMSTTTESTKQAKYKEQDFYKHISNRDEIQAILDRYEIELEKVEDVQHFCEIMSDIKEESSSVPNIATVIDRMVDHVVNTTQ